MQVALVPYIHSACFTIDRENYSLSDYKFEYESFWKQYNRYTSSRLDLKESRLILWQRCQRISSLDEEFGGFYAWRVKLSLRNRVCSGSWINDNFVLTTANCAGDILSVTMGSTSSELDQSVEMGISAVFKPDIENIQNVALVKLSSNYTDPEYKPLCVALNETRADCVVLGDGNDGVQIRELDVVPLDPSLCLYVARLQNIATDERSTCFRIAKLQTLNQWTSEAGSAIVCNMEGPGPPQLEGVLQAKLQMSDGEKPFVVTRVATFNEWIIEKMFHH